MWKKSPCPVKACFQGLDAPLEEKARARIARAVWMRVENCEGVVALHLDPCACAMQRFFSRTECQVRPPGGFARQRTSGGPLARLPACPLVCFTPIALVRPGTSLSRAAWAAGGSLVARWSLAGRSLVARWSLAGRSLVARLRHARARGRSGRPAVASAPNRREDLRTSPK